MQLLRNLPTIAEFAAMPMGAAAMDRDRRFAGWWCLSLRRITLR
jgi:hypothetical protein